MLEFKMLAPLIFDNGLSEFLRKYGMVPAPLIPPPYGLGAVLVRNNRERYLDVIGDIQSLAAEGCNGLAASVEADIDSAFASWAKEGFMDRVQEETRNSSPDVVTCTHIGDTVKVHFSFYGNVSMKNCANNSFTKLMGWLAKLYTSNTATEENLEDVRHYFLDRDWDPTCWKLNRQKRFMDDGSGILDKRVYIITDLLVASSVSTKKSTVKTYTMGGLKMNRESTQEYEGSGAPQLVAYRVIGADYDHVTGELSNVSPLKGAHRHKTYG